MKAPHNSSLGTLIYLVGAIFFLEHRKRELTEPPGNSHLTYATTPYALVLSSEKMTNFGSPTAMDGFTSEFQFL